jgi:hypothetical protein
MSAISDGGGFTSLRTVLADLATGSPSDSVIGTKRAGPVGIESIIEYRSANPIYLNVTDWIDTFIVTSIDGIDGADLRTGAQLNPGGHGETPTEALYGGRPLILSGKQYAQTIWKLRDMQQGLRGAFVDINQEYPLIFHAVDPADDLMIMCKLSAKINIPDQQTTRNDFIRDFQIPLRASNPRFLSVVRQVNAVTASAPGNYDNILFAAYNNGNFRAQTTIELKGPMTNPRILNETNGTVSIVNATIPNGETWVFENIGPSMRFYRKSDGENRHAYIDATSMWVYVEPNNVPNNIRLTATGLIAGSAVTMIHRHTVM